MIVVDVAGGEAAFEKEHLIRGPDRVRALSELGVDVLICGAISVDLEERLLAAGIEVVAEMRGEVREIVRAYLDGEILQPGFSMPGGPADADGPVRDFREKLRSGTEARNRPALFIRLRHERPEQTERRKKWP
jgi:predicted Fe-Mo cluster-binding NifX family protein